MENDELQNLGSGQLVLRQSSNCILGGTLAINIFCYDLFINGQKFDDDQLSLPLKLGRTLNKLRF